MMLLRVAVQALDRATRAAGGASGAARSFSVRFPRSILHPQFKNFTHVEAEQYLKEVTHAAGVLGGRSGSRCWDCRRGLPPK